MSSEQQKRLIALYSQMVVSGYNTTQNQFVSNVFSDMEIHKFRVPVRDLFNQLRIKSLLDYGCGGSNYELKHFDSDQSAIQYFDLDKVYLYEPARQLDQRQKTDAVVCFDVLEHIFVTDLTDTIRELFSYANKLLIVNVACYPAIALLPNGENAHITVRTPEWWKGTFDVICQEFPHIQVKLWCSTKYKTSVEYELFSAADWIQSETFVVAQTLSNTISLKQQKRPIAKFKKFFGIGTRAD